MFEHYYMERKIYNFESVILDKMTEEKEGFDPQLVGYQKKHIWAVCRFCGEPSRIIGSNFKKAGSACHRECRLKEQSLCGSPFSDSATKAKAQANRTKRISQDEINQRISAGRIAAQQKLENTNLERYGVKNVFQSDEIKNKIKLTNLDRYGVEHAVQNADIAVKISNSWKNMSKAQKDKITIRRKSTCKEKFNVDSPMQSETIRKKAEEHNLTKFGFSNPMMNKDVRDKAQRTMSERFGVKFALQNSDLLLKCQEKYNQTVECNFSHNFDNINLLRGEEFWADLSCGFSLNAICEKYNVDCGAIRYHLVQDEFRDRYYKTYTFPKYQTQRQIAQIFTDLGLNVVFNDRKTLNGIELDIFLPDKNFAIEYNGSYWHSESVLDPKTAIYKHSAKTLLCRKSGIRLFHLFENIWHTKKDQVLSFLLSALNLNVNKIMARKCQLTNDQGGDLIDKTHIQGFGNRTIITFDLTHNGNVVGSMSAAPHHRLNDPKIVVLNRMAFRTNTTVIGGASKLFSAFVKWAKEQGYEKIISWSDSCITEGNIYHILGFNLLGESRPDYFYWDAKNDCYVSKQSLKKLGSGKQAREWEKENKIYRIWDCGKKKWVFDL